MAEPRCHLVYAVAPEGVSAVDANRLFNDYIADRRRALVVFHDHFIGRHGGAAVFEIGTAEQRALLADPGRLAGWSIGLHPFVFSLTALGFAARSEFTVEHYGGKSLEQLRAEEQPNKRF